MSADELIFLLRAFMDADAEMRRSPHPRVELEIAAVRAARRPQPQAIEALIAKVDEAASRLRNAPTAPPCRHCSAQSPRSFRPAGAFRGSARIQPAGTHAVTRGAGARAGCTVNGERRGRAGRAGR